MQECTENQDADFFSSANENARKKRDNIASSVFIGKKISSYQ